MGKPAFRVGAVSFLNTVPLVDGLDEDPELLVLRDLPSRLADLLFEGRIDAGLVPVVEFLRGVGGEIVPGICIASHGRVKTVKVVSRVPIEQATDIAVDRGSRSSVAMLRVVLAERFGRFPDFHVVEPRPEHLFVNYDTVLVIGDRADQISADANAYVYDLGELWSELTNLPFVYAAWVLSPQLCEPARAEERFRLEEKLLTAKERGQSRLVELAQHEASVRGDLKAEEILTYWQDIIGYDLQEKELAGMTRFAQLAEQYNLCPPRPTGWTRTPREGRARRATP